MKAYERFTNTILVAVDGKLTLGEHKSKSLFAHLYPVEVAPSGYLRIKRIDNFGGFYAGTPIKTGKNAWRHELRQYCLVEFILADLPDGYYQYCNTLKGDHIEAGYLKIENGAIAAQFESMNSALFAMKLDARV